MKRSTPKTSEQPFDFFKELGGKELMHWLGTPCFIKERSKIFCNQVTIVTFDGLVFHKISIKELESMDPVDMSFI
jgi:hypothetical protein